MTRKCQFGHSVPKGRQKCLDNHSLVVSLKCDVLHCTYVTEPVDLMKLAVRLFKLHMSEEHRQVYKCNDKESDHVHCHLCFKVLHDKYMRKRHVKTQHLGQERHNCDHCEKSFATKTSLNYHTKKHHADCGGIKCEDCDEIFLDFKSYNDHIHSRSFHDTDGHKCVDCGHIIHGKRNLLRHMSTVHSLVPPSYKCDECNFETKQKFNLKIHKEQKHSQGIEIVFPCNKCEKTFKYKKSRTRHEKIAHDSKSSQPSPASQKSTSEVIVGDESLKQTKVYKVVKPRKAWFSNK